MSGRILLVDAGKHRDKHDHFVTTFTSGSEKLVFRDTRKFGVIQFLRDGEREFWEETIEDVTNQGRADEAERRAETLRAVAKLANAAAHEINNPLAVIVGRLELLRRDLPADLQGKLVPIVDTSKQIAELPLGDGTAYMLTRLAPGIMDNSDLHFSRPADNGNLAGKCDPSQVIP
mgnify:CR=1 FL=1